MANPIFLTTARSDGMLVGLARVLSDDVAIAYPQDILVRPAFEHRGIGTQLIKTCLERFSHVRQRVLLTDDQRSQHSFYRSVGFGTTDDLDVELRTFVQG